MPIDDLWYLKKRGPGGERIKSLRYGRGKRYRVRWNDDTGELRTEAFERKADAELHDANVRADLSRGVYVDTRAGQVTVSAYAEKWRANQLHVDTTTVLVEKAIRLHIAPTVLGRLPVKDVRRSHVQAWVKDRSAVLAPTTLRVMYAYLTSIFNAAVLDQVRGPSPCVGIQLPEVDRADRFIPTAGQVHALAGALPGHLSAAVYLAAGCGLRIGETLGLEVRHVDFVAREVHVVQQLKQVARRAPYLARLKSTASSRTLELPDTVAGPLRAHLERYPPVDVEIDDETDARRPVRRKAGLLFTSTGEPVQRASWSRWFAAAAKSTAGVPAGFGYHGLRHYFATLLIHGGASVKTVQLALGHATPTVTLNTYIHEWPDLLDRTRSLVDAALADSEAAAMPAGEPGMTAAS